MPEIIKFVTVIDNEILFKKSALKLTVNKIKIAKSISNILNDRQIILLFTDSELTEEVKTELNSSISGSFELIKDGSKSLTKIRPTS